MDKNNKDIKNQKNDLKIEFTPGNEDVLLATKKSEKQIADEENANVKIVSSDGVQNSSTDINSNLGKFENDFNPEANQFKDDDMIVADKSKELGTIRESDKKIDFAKFNKAKKHKVVTPVNNKTMIKIDTLLRNNRTLWAIWGTIITVIAICLAFTISFVTVLTIDQKNATGTSYFNFDWCKNLAMAANVLSYISMAAICLPLLYLLITVLVGINGVYRSRSYHLFLWSMLLIAVICMIISLIMSSYIISYEHAIIQPK